MKNLLLLALIAASSTLLFAQSPQPVNFNLVQVNHYNGGAAPASEPNENGTVVTKRVVIDVNSPGAMARLVSPGSAGASRSYAPVIIDVGSGAGFGSLAGAQEIPWETGQVIYSASGQDSFLVSSSRVGCPGTEVRPSVSISFAQAGGWSSPPIRFGPLNDFTTCALGRGYNLEVSAGRNAPPSVRIRDADPVMVGRR